MVDSEIEAPHLTDLHVARLLREATLQCKRAFSEGKAGVRDMVQTGKAVRELQEVLDTEAATETAADIKERMTRTTPRPGDSVKSIAVMLDGSSNSLAALKWAVETVLEPSDQLFLITVTPHEDFTTDAERILREAYDYAHNAGIEARRLHVRTLNASGNSPTAGVGEALATYIETEGIEQVVLGSRGLGSIKSSLLSRLGMGSVSDFCMKHLRCPVTVIKQEEDGSLSPRTVNSKGRFGQALGDSMV